MQVPPSQLAKVADETSWPKSRIVAGRLRLFWNWLHAEALAIRPIFLFFLTGFLLVFLIVKLALAQYSIGLNALSRALLGAALAAKVVLLLEKTPVARPFSSFPRIVPILFKSVIYGASVIVLGFLERTVDASRHARSLLAGVHTAFDSLNLHGLLSIALGVTLVFGVYFTFSEISELMGYDVLRDFLLKGPHCLRRDTN